MSVKKVRISELPQLQPDVSAEGLFMPAADENNHSYRVPLSRYDYAKNEAETATSAAQGAATLATAAANAANAAADAANAAALSTLAKSEPGDYAVTVQGAVKAPPYRRRREPSNFGEGNIMYRVGGFGATVDLKAYDSGDMKSIISAAAATGDVTVQFNGIYTSGWSGDAEALYTGIVDIHMHSDGSITAIALDTARLKRYMLYMPASDTGPGWQSADAGGGEPTGTAGGDLTGTYPNPTIKDSVNLPGSPTTTTQSPGDQSSKIANTRFVAINSRYDLKPAVCGCLDTLTVAFGIPNASIKAAFKNLGSSPLMMMVLFDGDYLYPAFAGPYRAVAKLVVDEIQVNPDDIHELRNYLGEYMGIYVYRGQLFTADACFHYPGFVQAGTMRGGFPIKAVGPFLSDVDNRYYYL